MFCRRSAWLLLGTVFALGCATSFHGEAKFPQGPSGCMKQCSAVGMVMSAFVYVGEYSTGCVCTLKRPRNLPAAQAATDEQGAAAATSAAAVGVVLQMRAAQQAATAAAVTTVAVH